MQYTAWKKSIYNKNERKKKENEGKRLFSGMVKGNFG